MIGGTGFLGYHASLELLGRGHTVTALGVPPEPPGDLLPPGITVLMRDITQTTDPELVQLLSGYEVVVFAAGADDRATPPSPAASFFYEANVRSSVRVTAAALRAGVHRVVILGSYFSYFDRLWPEMALAERHPYISSRKQQLELSMAVAGDAMAVVVLELPYIFGSMPGARPLWTPLVNYVRSGVPLIYPRGGSNMVAISRVAQAIGGACERINESRVFQVGDRNTTWTEFLQALCAIVGREDDTVHIIERASLNRLGWVMDALHAMKGLEGGLHSKHFADLMVAEAFFDPAESQAALGYGTGGLQQAWFDTVAAAPANVMFGNWKTFAERIPRIIRRKRGNGRTPD
ncbi:MAG: NAD(P)H-binding protein [Halioglobus sp.]